MPTTSMLKAKGLHTYNNYYSEIPEGSLLTAENVNIDRLSTVESRRGIKQYGAIGVTNSDTAKQLLLYKNRVLAHYANKIAFDDGSGIFTDFMASFTETESGLRVKFIEQNGSLYVTTSTGIRKICTNSAASLSSAKISNAGGIKALGGTASVNYATLGFLSAYSKVAYKIVWGTKDINNVIILGTPSTPIEATNQSTDSATVDVTFTVPQSATTDYFYRLYRTAVFTSTTFSGIQDIVINDEYNLVYEAAYTTGTEITINDIVPEDFREGGTPLYINENSGEGILQANEPPPFAKDIALYKNSAFYANTRTRYKLLIDMLGVGNLKSFGGYTDTIDVTAISYLSPDTTITFNAAPGLVVGKKIVITHSGSATLDGVQTVASVTGNQITVVADGTGAVPTNVSIYGSYLSITKGLNTDSYFFVGRPEIHQLTFPAYYAGIDQSYFMIYSADDQNAYVVYFHDTAGPVVEPSNSETDGKILIKVDVSATDTTGTLVATKVKAAIDANSFDFNIDQSTATLTVSTANSGAATDPDITTINSVTGLTTTFIQDGDGEDATNMYVRLSTLSSPSQRIDDTARSLAKIITQNATGDINAYYISGPSDAPGKMNFESRILDTTVFSVLGSDSGVGALFNPDITVAQNATNEEKPNRLYYSKTSQPEAVPLVNYVDVGPQDKLILRILGLRDSLFIIKEEGIYRLTGESPTNFTVTLFDNSANVVAPDTCVVMDNQIFGMTSQGIARISETGVDIISQPVQDAFNLSTSPRYVNFKTASFACAYVQDYAYIIWIPKNPTDTTGTIAYRFSTKTETWTTWKKTGNAISAIVNPSINKLYIGPDDDNLVEIERKDMRRIDFADRQYDLNIANNAITDTSIQLSSLTNITVGDMLVQSQYVTATLIERLCRKLAMDAGVPDTVGNNNKDFYRDFTVNPGDSLQTRLSEVITQLNSDLGTSYLTSFSTNITTFQTEYNSVIDLLNASTILLHSNYSRATVLIEYEVFISALNTANSSVTVELIQPLATGPITHYKAIDCTVVYAPYYFGDPAVLKHVRDGTIMFANASLTRGTIGYSTDLSANFEDIPFGMEGTGNWGTWIYDSIAWGGEGTARPFRTLIPRQKQRCRYIKARFKHKAAFDEFRILGISYTFEGNSERAYK